MKVAARWLTCVQLARHLGVSTSTVERAVRKQLLPAPSYVSIRCPRWRLQAVEEWLVSRGGVGLAGTESQSREAKALPGSNTQTRTLTLLDRIELVDFSRQQFGGRIERMASCVQNSLARLRRDNNRLAVALDDNDELVSLIGFAFCGKQYCPVCAPMKARRIEQRLQALMDADAPPQFMVTLTVSSRRKSRYGEALDAFASAFKAFRSRFGQACSGNILAWVIEPLCAAGAWHIHAHALVSVSTGGQKALSERVSDKWGEMCARHGLKTDKIRGAKVTPARAGAATYLAKSWAPVVRSSPQGGRTPLQLFVEAHQGCAESYDAIEDYLLASVERKGFRMAGFCHGAPKMMERSERDRDDRWAVQVDISKAGLKTGAVANVIRESINRHVRARSQDLATTKCFKKPPMVRAARR